MKLFKTVEANIHSRISVGDIIAFTLNDGEEVEALAVKQEQDGMIFCLVDCLRDECPMDETTLNERGYKGSYLRHVLDTEIRDRFPAEIRERMVLFPCGDFLRIPTEREIFGRNVYGIPEDESVEQWEPMKKRRNRIALHDDGIIYSGELDIQEWYWLQNKHDNSSGIFASVNVDGMACCYAAYYASGVRPVFKIDI